jgi:spore germination cell wall hydrolase CwlJ-like protein
MEDAMPSEAPTASDEDTLARTLWGEARGEGREGMAAVAWVVRNRAAKAGRHETMHGRQHPLFGDGTAASACLRPLQFSCWNATDPNRARLTAVTREDPQFRIACEVAAAVLDGGLADPTNGATHYHEASIHPAWAEGQTPTARIGRHVFYRLTA